MAGKARIDARVRGTLSPAAFGAEGTARADGLLVNGLKADVVSFPSPDCGSAFNVNGSD